MPRLLEPVERATYTLANRRRALTNLVIARMRLTHDNKYETNYAPNVPYIRYTTP